jgi:hypothetical protein
MDSGACVKMHGYVTMSAMVTMLSVNHFVRKWMKYSAALTGIVIINNSPGFKSSILPTQ